METNPLYVKVLGIIDSYNSHYYDKSKLILYAKEIFYSNLRQQSLPIDVIKMYYILTSIIDSEDLKDDEFDKEIEFLYAILNGKKRFQYNLAVCIAGKTSDLKVEKIRQIVVKLKNGNEINKEDCLWFNDYISSEEQSVVTLDDYIKLSIKKSLKWAYEADSDTIRFDPSHTLFIQDEKGLEKEVLEGISRLIDCLYGKRNVYLAIDYNGEGAQISIQS